MKTNELFGVDAPGEWAATQEDVEALFGSESSQSGGRPAGVTAPIQWLLRTYQTADEWKRKARDVFFTVNGDSNVARNRVASMVRSYFVDTKLEPEDIQRWKTGENAKESIRVVPPKITVSNATYVDWIYIADFLLLPNCSPTEELEAENQRRDTEFDNALRSYRKRLAVEAAYEIIRSGSTATDKAIADSLSETHPDVSEAAVKIARKQAREKIVEPKSKEPQRAEPMPPYDALYFPRVNASEQTQVRVSPIEVP